MAWTNIPDDVLEPGKPIRSVDAIALRDNPIAIAQGLPGAPRVLPSTAIDWAASTNTAAERDWVLNRTAGASAGAVGTYVFARSVTASVNHPLGSTIAGSSLRPASAAGEPNQGALTGTWRAMGRAVGSNLAGDSPSGTTLWLRIS